MSDKKNFLKGLIFKDETPTVKAQESSKPVNVMPTNPVTTSTGLTVQGVADNKFIEMLSAKIEENNQQGVDYFEFKQAVENMKSMAMGEDIKYQTAYQVLTLQKLTKEVLLSSIDVYMNVIQNEKGVFDGQMKQQFASKVQAKLDEVQKARTEMENITKRLNELNNSILTLSQEAQAEEMKLRATEANFMASADIILKELMDDKTKITNFIK